MIRKEMTDKSRMKRSRTTVGKTLMVETKTAAKSLTDKNKTMNRNMMVSKSRTVVRSQMTDRNKTVNRSLTKDRSQIIRSKMMVKNQMAMEGMVIKITTVVKKRRLRHVLSSKATNSRVQQTHLKKSFLPTFCLWKMQPTIAVSLL